MSIIQIKVGVIRKVFIPKLDKVQELKESEGD
jgi:hypothetical protein